MHGHRTAKLSSEYRQRPLWWDDAGLPSPLPQRLPSRVDAVIVGTGYTGLAAARELSRRGREVAVLDRQRLGMGASSRNAGMIHAGLQHDVDDLERRYGARGRALHQVSVDAFAFVERLAAEVAPDAGHSRCGWLHLAHRRSRLDELRRQSEARRRVGEVTRILEPSELGDESQCSGFFGAMLTDNGASIHPARYLAGLARAATAAGAAIHESVAVTAVAPRPSGGFDVHTDAGTIAARDVLIASNGYTDGAVPALRRRIIPIGSYIIATEPLDVATADSLSRGRRMMTDSRNFLHYWRLTPDRRLLFGGRASFTPISLPRARDRLYTAMVTAYPQLRGTRVSHAWTGRVGFTFDRLPHIGRSHGVTYAMGYCGSGVAMASWFGHCAATWIAGEAPIPFVGLDFPTAPGYTGRPWFLPMAGWYYQLRDRLG